MRLFIISMTMLCINAAICQQNNSEAFFKPINFKSPCEYWGNPDSEDSLEIASKGLKRSNQILEVHVSTTNLYETLKSIERYIIYIGRNIGNWENSRYIGLHILTDAEIHYFITICFNETIELENDRYFDCIDDDFDEVYEYILKNYKFDFHIYRGKIDNYINYLRKNIDWTRDDISRIDSLRNEMRKRKNKINDK